MNLKLAHVVSDLTGVTGLAIIRAILAGERNPQALAALRDRRCKHDVRTIARSLEGTWREEHLFALRQALALVAGYQQHLATCDRQIEAYLTQFADQSDGRALAPGARPRKPRRTAPAFDPRSHLYRLTGVDLTQIDGIDGGVREPTVRCTGRLLLRRRTERQPNKPIGRSMRVFGVPPLPALCRARLLAPALPSRADAPAFGIHTVRRGLPTSCADRGFRRGAAARC
jgi:hypothetical protein